MGKDFAAMNVLVINPGSTSTKVAVYANEKVVLSENVSHVYEELVGFDKVMDQRDLRNKAVLNILKDKGFDLNSVDVVVGRGGALKPLKSGAYQVNEAMLKDLLENSIYQHVSNLGAVLASDIAKSLSIEAYIADPISVDELCDLARVSGLKDVPRISMLHALSIKATAHKLALEISKPFSKLNAIIVHLGGGISVCAIKDGEMIDTNNANEEGPFSPERAGSLPMGELLALCTSGKFTKEQMKNKVLKKAGFVGYLGTSDAREVEKLVEAKDEKALAVSEAMFYQISKEIGAMACVLSGKVDGIALTGGLANWKRLVDYVTSKVSFIAKVHTYPGENEMKALYDAIGRVKKGEEKALTYI